MEAEALAATALTTAVAGIVSAAVASVIAMAKAKNRESLERTAHERAMDEAMKAGMRALLWAELQRIHEKAMEQGGLTVDERKHLESVYAAYHGLGGNGTGTRLFQDAMNQKVID